MSYGAQDKIVMTPLTANEGKVIQVSRVPENQLKASTIEHSAGGSSWAGIIINKPSKDGPSTVAPHAERKFTAIMRDHRANDAEVKEKRHLRFWFQMYIAKDDYEKTAEKFFQTLLNPHEFPTDYIGYVQRILKLAKDFDDIATLEMVMRPPRPGEDDEIKLKRRPTMRIAGRGGTSVTIMQDDHHALTEEEQEDGGIYSGTSDSSRIGRGASLDRKFAGNSQEDQLRHGYRSQAPGGSLDGYYRGDSTSPGAVGDTRYKYGAQDQYQRSLYRQSGSHLTFGDQSIYGGSVRAVRQGPKLSKQGHMIIWIAKKQKILNTLEDAYPNAMQKEELATLGGFHKDDISRIPLLLQDLKERGLINDMGNGRWLRIQKLSRSKEEEEGNKPTPPEKVHKIQYVPHIPYLDRKDQPTIAVVTLLYCEKLAVDAMLNFKTTFVRYKSSGEGQVYTIGHVGKHKVVTTKLSRIGYGEGAKTSAGNTITRLLGTFGEVEHVILVGVGGGVPDYNDDNQHVRMGDIVVSKTDGDQGPMYVACTGYERDPSENTLQFHHRSWSPRDNRLERITTAVYRASFSQASNWEEYLRDALEELEQHEIRFFRPPPETDKLRREDERGRLREVQHPVIAPGSARDMYPTVPVIHHGLVGSGKMLAKSQLLREQFSERYRVKVVDCGFQAVMDSIEGNRKDSFIIVRGICDYIDGAKRKEWQPYCALAAAAYMKQLVLNIPTDDDEDDD